MRICLISREYPPDTGWGGIGAYTFQHAHGLKRLGHDVEVIALAKKEVSSEQDIAISETDGIRVHRVVWGPLLEELSTICLTAPYTHYILKCSLALWQKFLKIHRTNPFDVVEAPEHLAEGIFPALTKICPLVLRLHTPHHKFVAERYHNLVPSFDLHMAGNLERVAMLEADVLSSPSIDLAKYVAKDCGYDLNKIAIVRNPVDAEAFTPEGVSAITKNGQPIVFFAGRLEERKGIYHLISAVPKVLKKCPNTKFVIVGNDTNTARNEGSVLSELKSMLKTSGCLEAVNFVGVVPLAQMADYYRCADICVVASLYDNAPYTVLEAMACAKPVVGSAVGGIPEYVVDGKTGLVVPPSDPDSLADAITQLISDKDKRISLGNAARERIMECFEREVIAKQALETYELAINRYKSKAETTALYRKAPEDFIADFLVVLCSYHDSLSELIYVQSAKLNRQYWKQLITHRPKLAFAKVCLNLVEVLKRVPVLGMIMEPISKRLAVGIANREQEIKEKMRQRLYSYFPPSS